MAGRSPLDVFPDRLQDCINRKKDKEGITQNAIAEKLGEKPATLSKWATGSAKPDNFEKIMRLVSYFNVSADWLFGLERIDVRSTNPAIRKIANLTRLSSDAIERLNYNPPFKPMSPEEAERAIKERTLPPRAWTDEEIGLLSQMIVDGSLLEIIRHINNYDTLAKYDALKRKRYELTGEREEGVTIGTEYGTGKEFIVDTNFSVSMELEQYKAQKAVTMYTEKLNSNAQAAYKNVGEQNGRANKKDKKGR